MSPTTLKKLGWILTYILSFKVKPKQHSTGGLALLLTRLVQCKTVKMHFKSFQYSGPSLEGHSLQWTPL